MRRLELPTRRSTRSWTRSSGSRATRRDSSRGLTQASCLFGLLVDWRSGLLVDWRLVGAAGPLGRVSATVHRVRPADVPVQSHQKERLELAAVTQLRRATAR